MTETEKLLTADEFMEIHGHEHCELVRGRVIPLAPAGARHGVVTMRIGRVISEFVDEHDLGEVACGDAGHRIAKRPDTIRGPDVGFVHKDRIPATGAPSAYWDVAPDLAVEVISPSDRWNEVEAKTREWLDAGVREVWLVDPEQREVRVVTAGAAPRVLQVGDEITSDVLPGFRAPVDAVFGR